MEALQYVWCELLSEVLVAFWSSSVTTNPERWLKWSPLSPDEHRVTRSLLSPSDSVRESECVCLCVFKLINLYSQEF